MKQSSRARRPAARVYSAARYAAAAVAAGVCLASGGIGRAEQYAAERVATGLSRPVYVTQAPGEDEVLYVVEQRLGGGNTGRISAVDAATGARSTFLTIEGLDPIAGFDDGGLHTMAFHPDYEQNGRFYVSWVDSASNSRVDEFTLNGDQSISGPSLVLSYPTLASRAGRHSIGWIGFRPDAGGDARNSLYITTGEGGFPEGAADYANVSQDLGTPYGKVLRVQVGDGSDAYPADPDRNFGVRQDNPYANAPGALGEVFHSGLRNPWRASFDRETSDFYIGDVGWLTFEEINFAREDRAGLDFGWSRREGTLSTPGGVSPDVGGPRGRSIDPAWQYGRDEGASTVGGYVYRGEDPLLQGQYFFADSVSGNLWAGSGLDRDVSPLSLDGQAFSSVVEISDQLRSSLDGGPLNNVVSFGEDNAGNLYVVRLGNGSLGGIQPNSGEVLRLTTPAQQAPEERTDAFVLVNPATGEMQLRNQSEIDIEFDGYRITSDEGSLLPDSWNPLAASLLGSGWRESNVSQNQLAELLQEGELTLPAGHAVSFGAASHTAASAGDVTFEYLPAGATQGVAVPVVLGTVAPNADFNRDGVIDAADYTVWRDHVGRPIVAIAADGDGNGVVDTRDFEVWRSSFGQSTPALIVSTEASSAPEPCSLAALASIGWLSAARPRQRR